MPQLKSYLQTAPIDLYRSRVNAGILRPDQDQERAVRALDRLYDDLSAPGEKSPISLIQKLLGIRKSRAAPRGVYMYGGVGRGKTVLMDLFFECVPAPVSKRRVHFHAFMISAHDYIHAKRQEGESADDALPALAQSIAENARLLCFDEFHVTDIADAMILGRLFTLLWDRGVTVVATSNWAPDRLYEGGLQRDRFTPFIALLREHMEIVHLDSEVDYRARCLREEGTYFWPFGRATGEKAEALFMHLTGGALPVSETIAVKGRTIEVREAAKGCARFSFSQLCEQPHGAEDYIAIARKYNTVFLENVPSMGYDRRNEAKRLMTFIDALYEAKTKLVITAECDIEHLYYGSDHAFEFKRTISRLLEMQSEEYLSKTG